MQDYGVIQSENQFFKTLNNVLIDIKREDLLHPEVSGNKLRKLKYNILHAQEESINTLVTYGGAFSNHIAATSAAAKIAGLSSIGIIRGEELGLNLKKTLASNNTLLTAHNNGMKFHFVTRESYKQKDDQYYRELFKEHGKLMIIPEGGTNQLAIQGTKEILTDQDKSHYDFIAVAGGTGGTAAGIIESSAPNQKVLVFSALKGGFLKEEINKLTLRSNFQVFSEDRFGGYARSDNELIKYMNSRFRESGVPLDPIYTSKMMFHLEDLILKGVFPKDSRILAIHTGGLQAIAGYNQMLKRKRREEITYEFEI
ncbi:1-aminocyclopropane-1-carboxylate deaminase/D-cysteine desulfhydrase [Nonlabens tegetincola]|uniref:1-aminocyclopropane-1-carboxylate deaminase/D-cysteine desulfhydrase n=1 Tax=Nonlabens tegetincola TaxID=323273 RepID=UPI000CF5546E|nr:pyridoxal-phosphate dependent enzyme [Nonlabens tegetincola]PQJ14130.1 1-aminocyclopropane-1-carboxylate deaminase [Nonlabens tegetincola]